MNKNSDGIHISILLMVKNEKKRLSVTLESIKNFADSLLLYDTGSTDNTIEIAENFCKENNIPFYLKQEEFIDYATSRNIALEFAESFENIDYILFLDCNDEIQNSQYLRKIALDYLNTDIIAFSVCRKLLNNIKQEIYFYDIKFFKNKKSFYYTGKVHESINFSDLYKNKINDVHIKIDHQYFCLYQDLINDDDKSEKRYKKDYDILLSEYKYNLSIKKFDTRISYYLGQTCYNLKLYDEALYYYKNSYYYVLNNETKNIFYDNATNEYLYEVAYRIATTFYIIKTYENSIIWYLKSYEHSERVEPLICLTCIYMIKNNIHTSYLYINRACKLNYIETHNSCVNLFFYEYFRWHLKSVITFQLGMYEKSKKATEMIIKNNKDNKYNIECDSYNIELLNKYIN